MHGKAGKKDIDMDTKSGLCMCEDQIEPMQLSINQRIGTVDTSCVQCQPVGYDKLQATQVGQEVGSIELGLPTGNPGALTYIITKNY